MSQTTNYVSVAGSGSADGSDWSNTLPAGFTPVRGRYYYLADGSYGGKTWSTATSGATKIFVIKATEADHGTATGWSSAFGDGIAQYSTWSLSQGSQYWHFDGNNAPGGDFGCGLAVVSSASPTYFVRLRSGNLFVKHLEVDGTGSSVNGFGIVWEGPNTTIQQCYVHDTPNDAITDDGTFDGTGNYLVQGCRLGPRGDSGGTHGDMFTHQISSGGIFRTNIVSWNGQLMWFGVPGPNSGTYEIYGNVFSAGPQSETPSGSCTVLKAHSSGDGDPAVILFYNNTVVNVNNAFQTTGEQPGLFRNNLFFDMNDDAISYGNQTHTHNWYETGMTFGTEATSQSGSDPFESLGGEDYHLAANTDAGFDLGAPYNVDRDGTTRSTWSRGAFEFDNIPPGPDTNAPTITSVTIDSNGTNWALVWSEACRQGTEFSVTNFYVTMTTAGAIALTFNSGNSNSTWNFYSATVVNGCDTVSSGFTVTGTNANMVFDLSTNAFAGVTNKAVANNSTIGQVATPVVNLPTGYYYGQQTVSNFIATAGATMHYTLDGSTPSAASTAYTGAFNISTGATMKVIGIKAGSCNSLIASATWQINSWRPDANVFHSITIPTQNDEWTATFDVIPGAANSDVVIAFCDNPFTAYDDGAAMMRWSSAGVVDARSNTVYLAVNTLNWSAGAKYSAAIIVRTNLKSFTVGGTLIATNFAFRSTQSGATNFNVFGFIDAGSSAGTISNLVFDTDTIAPVVNIFLLPATHTSLSVPISDLAASDNVAVTGYLVNQSASVPAASDPGWIGSVPATAIAAGAGSQTFYAWSKDGAGNISASLNDTVTITLPAGATATVITLTVEELRQTP